MYENKVELLKAKDLTILEDYLAFKEEEEAKRKAEEAGAASGNQAAKGKADPKKDAKKPPAKGAVVTEDKNAP